MRKQSISNIAFYMTTVGLILIIVLCIGRTVKSEGAGEIQRIENRAQEQQMLTQMRQYLNENGYRNSGVTLTYVTAEDGRCDYTFTIHHRRIDEMKEEERERLTLELLQVCNVTGDSAVTCEYLLMD